MSAAIGRCHYLQVDALALPNRRGSNAQQRNVELAGGECFHQRGAIRKVYDFDIYAVFLKYAFVSTNIRRDRTQRTIRPDLNGPCR
jgi:hypothetical protein